MRVHHLVLEAFVEAVQAGMDGLHWDDDPLDNRVELAVGDGREDQLDVVRNRDHHQVKKTTLPQGA